MNLVSIVCILCASLYIPLAVAVPPVIPNSQKKIIEFGWDMPNTEYVQSHIREMERFPFNGLILSARYRDLSGKNRLFHDEAFGPNKISWLQLRQATNSLAQTRFLRFTHNFLRFNVSPGTVDWFDDFSPIIHNSRMAGRIVTDGRIKGIAFDLEQYKKRLFNFSTFENPSKRTFAEYQKQVRLRAEEIMRAFQIEAPGLTIFLTISYDQAESSGQLSEWKYGLLPAFLDGLFSAAEGSTKIIDGYEASYGFARQAQFDAAYTKIHQGNLKMTGVPEAYKQRVSAAFATWLDYGSHQTPWSTTDLTKNYFTPHRLSEVLQMALTKSDEYIWIYSEQPKFWTNENLPREYVNAIRSVQQGLVP